MHEEDDQLVQYGAPSNFNAGQAPQILATPRTQDSFRTPHDQDIVDKILLRNKEEKIESRSSLKKHFMRKSKRTKFSQREIFRALASVVNGQERAGPGAVEILRDLLIAQGGDVNFIPQNKSLGSVFRKRHEDRSGLLEIAARDGNVEVVQLLSRYSDKTSLDNSLEIALRSRDASTTNRSAMRKDQMIQVLISYGADGSSTISAAVAVGDETLLHLLLGGQPPVPTLSEALPISVTLQDVDRRWRITRLLLEQGADVNYNGGEAILQATKQSDMLSLDMLLERRPQGPSLSRAFASALSQPDSNNRLEACQKLITAGATGEEVNRGLTVAITVEYQNIYFLKLILSSASVDFENGRALCLAITNDHSEHLLLMLEKRPNGSTFDSAFAAAMRLRNLRDQLRYCRLLVGAGPPRDSCSKALVIAVRSQKEELCKVFLENGASPDFDGGASVAAAVSSENIGILELLVRGGYDTPSNASLATGFEAALSTSTSQSKQMKLLRIILEAGLNGPTLDGALVNIIKRGHEGLPLCRLFLEYGASINAQGGEALDICARTGDLELLEILLYGPCRPSVEILCRIFQSSQKLEPRIRYLATNLILQAKMPINDQVAAALDTLVQHGHPDMQTIGLLLSYGASVHYQNHRPIVTATKTFNKILLSLLLQHSRDESAASVAFDAVMKMDSFWGKQESFTILTVLLEHGADGASVNEALIKAVADPHPSARHFEITLLQHRVDINYKAGEALQIATERGEPALIRRMLSMNPNTESVSMAFPFAFLSRLGGESTLAVIDSFTELSAGELDPEFMHPTIPEPPVFLCLKHYPNSLEILESTLRAGFHVDQMVSSDKGNITALYWSLSAQGKEIRDDVVEHLISRGADLHNHPDPLLHRAIENSRHRIVQCLVDAQADVDLADENDLTPLSLATLKNDVISMQLLLGASASSNDGSLHYAARMVNADSINLLLTYGHDANFPWIRCDGRPPLFELCFQAPAYLQQSQGTAQQKEKKIKKAIQALISGGALIDGQLSQAGNRSILIHALDSASPYMMTKAFLECGQFKYINEVFNLFTDGEYTFSPTKYVEKGKFKGDKTQSQALITLLKSFQATDRYWKNSGTQPPDTINPPEYIRLAEEERKAIAKRRAREDEERRYRIEEEQRRIEALRIKIALEQEAEQAKQNRIEMQFQQRQAHEQRIHAANIAKENDKLRLQEARDQHALRQAASMSNLRNDENEMEYSRRMRLISEKRSLAQSEVALGWAYNKGLQDAGPPRGQRALGMSSRSNLDLGRRLQIEGPRFTEIEEEG